MATTCTVDELRLSFDNGTHIEWRRAPVYPAPLGSQLAWERIAIASVSPEGEAEHEEDTAREEDKNARGIIRLFFQSAELASFSDGHHYRIIIPLDSIDIREVNRLFSINEPSLYFFVVWLAGRNVQLILQSPPQETRKRRLAELEFPLKVTFVGTRREPSDLWRSDAIRTIPPELFQARDVRVRGYSEAQGAILQVVDISSEAPLLSRYIDVMAQAPRLAILGVKSWHVDLSEATRFARRLLDAGCPAVAIVPSDGGRTNRLEPDEFIKGLLRDWPLDRALAEAGRAADFAVPFLLFAAEGAEATRFLSGAMLEHRNQQGLRLLDVLDGATQHAPLDDELSAFLIKRLADVQKKAKDIAIDAHDLSIHDTTEMGRAFLRAHRRAQEALRKWQRIRAIADGNVGRNDPNILLESLGPATDSKRDRQKLPPRRIDAWIATSERSDERLEDSSTLAFGRSYRLNAQICFTRERSSRRGDLLITHLREAFRDEEAINVDFIAFAPKDAIELPVRSLRVRLPRFGESRVASFPFTIIASPRQTERRRVRIGVYHKNRLLQSIAVDFSLDAGQTTYEIDYIASEELLTFDELPKVTLSLFLNETPDGTHWLGIAGLRGAPPLLTLDPQTVRARVHDLWNTYETSQRDRPNLYRDRLASRPAQWMIRKDQLVEIAHLGRSAFFDLILRSIDDDQRKEFEAALREPEGLIQIARCHPGAPAIPWGIFYVYDLAPEGGRLCNVFEKHLRKNSEDGERRVHDLLDDPAACARQPCCPLRDPPRGAQTVVCPFGFWGIRHRIEQPMHCVPSPLTNAGSPSGRALQATTSPRRHAQGNGSIATAYWKFLNINGHMATLSELARERGGAFNSAYQKDAFDSFCRAMTTATIIYFYCHGDVVRNDFALKLGHDGAKWLITADMLHQALNRDGLRLESAPLVVLNGCQTLAVTPEKVNGFLDIFRWYGASGVVGLEVPVWSHTASLVGERLLEKFLAGETLGHALLAVRRELMRELCPVGLMYVAYSSSELKFVPPPALEAPAGPPASPSDASPSRAPKKP